MENRAPGAGPGEQPGARSWRELHLCWKSPLSPASHPRTGVPPASLWERLPRASLSLPGPSQGACAHPPAQWDPNTYRRTSRGASTVEIFPFFVRPFSPRAHHLSLGAHPSLNFKVWLFRKWLAPTRGKSQTIPEGRGAWGLFLHRSCGFLRICL